MWMKDSKKLVVRLEGIFAKFMERGLSVTAYKTVFFGDEIKACVRMALQY